MQPAHDIEMVVGGCQVHRVGGAALGAVLVQELHDVQVAEGGGPVHGVLGASLGAVLVQPLDDVEMAVSGREVHRPLGEAGHVWEQTQVPVGRGRVASPLRGRAAVLEARDSAQEVAVGEYGDCW